MKVRLGPRPGPVMPQPLRALLFSLLLCAPAPLVAAQALASAQGTEQLEAALDSITEEALSVDLHYFAGDEMQGRDTPSSEQRVAARFLQARLERLGVAPGAEHGYLSTYPLLRKTLDFTRTAVKVRGEGGEFELTCAADYFFRSRRAAFPLNVEAWAVFCGSGSREEFEVAKMEGRWAVCFGDDEVSTTRRRRNAERAKAAGLVILPPRPGSDDPYAERFAELTATVGASYHTYPSARDLEKLKEKQLPELYLSRAAAIRLLEASAARGQTPVEQWVPKPGLPLGVQITDVREGPELVDAENVCGFWRGDDPELWREVIILSAHYDHVGARDGRIFNGADDNGSGSIGLLAIAEALVKYGPMRRSVLFLWVSGEEKGLWGSRAWTENPWLPEGTYAIADINVDMIGRNAPDHLQITPSRRHDEYSHLSRIVETVAAKEGFEELESADAYWQRSDHVNFVKQLKIPAVFLFTGEHEDYHRPTDTADKIDYDKMRRVCRVIVRTLHELQHDKIDG